MDMIRVFCSVPSVFLIRIFCVFPITVFVNNNNNQERDIQISYPRVAKKS